MYLCYGDFWFGLFESPEYKEIALQPLQQLILMADMYMLERIFIFGHAHGCGKGGGTGVFGC